MGTWNLATDDQQVSVRHADASGGDIRENQHEVDRMRDIQVGKRGPEATGEEQPAKLRLRFEQEASSAAASSDPTVALEYLASGETQDRGRHIGKVLEWYRGKMPEISRKVNLMSWLRI